MPVAALLPSLISGGSALAQGILGSRAATGAANTQANAAEAAARLLEGTANAGATDVTNAGMDAARAAELAAQRGTGFITGATAEGQQRVGLSAEEANAILRQIYGDSIASFSPFQQAGQVALNQIADPNATRPFTAEDFKADPGYEFRLAEGQKALERAASARGSLMGGATLKELTRYAQGVASDEYSKAFDRFQTERATKLNTLGSLAQLGLRTTETAANLGQTYGGRVSANTVGAAEYGANLGYRGATDAAELGVRGTDAANRFRLGAIGDAARLRLGGSQAAAEGLTSAAAARGAGQVGRANAWGSTLRTLASVGQEAAMPYAQRARRRLGIA